MTIEQEASARRSLVSKSCTSIEMRNFTSFNLVVVCLLSFAYSRKETTKIKNTTNGRAGTRRDFNQVKSYLLRELKRLLWRHDPKIRSFRDNYAPLRREYDISSEPLGATIAVLKIATA